MCYYKKAFTLVELMVVIVIIGILAALAIPRFMQATSKAKVTEFKPVLKQIFTLEDAFRTESPSSSYGALTAVGFMAPTNSARSYFNYNLTATVEATGTPGTLGVTAAPTWSATNSTLANASPNTNGRTIPTGNTTLAATDKACVDFIGAMYAPTVGLQNLVGGGISTAACP